MGTAGCVCNAAHPTSFRGRFRWLRGPATNEIDPPHLRARHRLNRGVNLILSQSPSSDVNAWEFAGKQCGNRVGMWELDRVSLRSMASGGDRPFRGPGQRDIRCQTRTLVAPGADGTASPARMAAISRSLSRTFRAISPVAVNGRTAGSALARPV